MPSPGSRTGAGCSTISSASWPTRTGRLGGDEFCLLWHDPGEHELVVERACTALAEHGDGFVISAAHGSVVLPSEAGTPMEALRLADQRMYTQKHGRGLTPGEQSTGVLLTPLAERDPGLCDHVNGVGELAEALAERLGLVRRRTLVGERILLAAPALSHVAGIVRSSHERFDGRGYPDGLEGDAYAARLTEAEAVEELRREAGRQFDPQRAPDVSVSCARVFLPRRAE